MTVIVNPDELDAIIESGGVASSMSANNLILKSGRSGPFSWTKSACASALFIVEVKANRSRLAPGERPISVRAGHASSTYLRRLASALGAGSVAITSNPRARYCAAQLAPITPVPTIAMRRTGLLKDISALRCGKFGVGNAGEVALGIEEVALVRSVEIGGIDRTSEVGDEHTVTWNVEGDADPLHQVRDQNLRRRVGVIDPHPIDGIAA